MNCPNCDHRLDNCELSHFSIDEKKTKFTLICPQCKNLIHFIVNDISDDEGLKCYAWAHSKEKKYADIISKISNKRYILFVQPTTKKEDALAIARQFGISYGNGSAFIFPEKFSYIANQMSCIYSVVILPDNLFPENPSYLAEKLIIENTNGEIFSTEKTIHKKFQIL